MKIYNKIILKWNDKTNRFDTIYEDSYEHSGRVDYAAPKKKGGKDEYGGPTPEAIKRWRENSKIASEVLNIEQQLVSEASKWNAQTQEGMSYTKNIAAANERIASAEVAKNDVSKRYWGKNKELGERILKEQVDQIKAAATEEHGRLAASNSIQEQIDSNLKNMEDKENSLFGVRKKSLDVSNELLETVKKQVNTGDLTAAQGNKINSLMQQMNAEGLTAAAAAKIRSDIEQEIIGQIGQGNDAYVEQLQNVGKMGEARVLEEETLSASQARLEGMDNLTGGMIGKAEAFKKQFGGANARITGTFAVLGLIIGLMTAIGAQTDMVGEKFGAIGVNEFKGPLVEATADAQRLGYGFEEVASTVSSLSGEFGVSFGEATKMSGAVLDTAKAIGMSTSEAAKLTGQLMLTSGLSAEGAQNFMKQAAGMAKAAGVAPGAVMEDMASSSADIANFTKGSGENMVKAAVGAKAMGLSLGDVAKAAEGLLSFQDSISKEMEASALIGRNLNLQRARELTLAGDLEGVRQEMLKQVGTEAEFNEMNIIQRKALADAMNMEVGQLQKMVSHAGKTNAELMSMSDVDISQIVGEDAIGNVTRLTNQLKAAGTQLLGFISGIANLGGIFGTLPAPMAAVIVGLVALGGYFAFVVGKTLIQAKVNKMLAKSIDEVTAAEIRKKTATGTPDLPKKTPGPGLMSKFKMPSASAMLKGAAAVLVLSAAMFVAAKAFQQFGDVEWPAVGIGLVGITALATIAMVLGKAKGNLLQGAFAIGVLSLSLLPMAFAFNMIKDVGFGTILGFGVALTSFAIAAALLGGFAAPIALGAGAIFLLGTALIPASYAFSLLTEVNTGMLLQLSGVLLALGASFGLIGIMTPAIILGSAGMLLLSASLIPMTYALSLLKGVDTEMLSALSSVLINLGSSMALLGLMTPAIILGSVGMNILSASLIPMTNALSLLQGVDIGILNGLSSVLLDLGSSMALLGVMTPFIILGSVAMNILSASLIPMTSALSLLQGVDTGMLTGLGQTLFDLGSSMGLLGSITPLILLGSFALGIMSTSFGIFGSSMILMGTGLQMTMPFLTELGNIMGQLLPQVEGINLLASSLTNLAGGLFMVGTAGLFAAPALTLLGATGLLGGNIGEAATGEETIDDAAGPNEMELLKTELVEIKNHLKTLTTGFGEGPIDGGYLTGIGQETAKGIKNSKLTATISKGII
jgi:hypothetical protein